jgi:hypothetical protein
LGHFGSEIKSPVSGSNEATPRTRLINARWWAAFLETIPAKEHVSARASTAMAARMRIARLM